MVEWVEIDVNGVEKGASASKGVSIPTGRSVGRLATCFLVTKL